MVNSMDSADKKILVVVDMQNDFIDGALGTPEARSIVDRVCSKIRGWNGKIYFTRDAHGEDYPYTPEGKLIPIPHCFYNDYGAELCADVLRAIDYHHTTRTTLTKGDFTGKISLIPPKSTFGSNSWSYLLDPYINEVEICGLCTDYCVLANAIVIQASLPNARIVVDASCCAGSTPEMHQKAIEIMEHLGIEVVNKV